MAATLPVTVRISVEINERLERLANSTARSKSWLAAEAIGAFGKSESQFLDAVEEGRKAAREGQTIAHEEIGKWLAFWGDDNELPPPAI